MNSEIPPLLKRIKINTVAAPDIKLIEDWYSKYLGYNVCEQGILSEKLASSWGTPKMVDRPYSLMQPKSQEDVFIRVCEIDKVENYKPMTTLGWNSFEIIVDNVYELYDEIKKSPFKIIGKPASLGGDLDFIHAMQVEGPAGDILYLTCDRVRAPDTLLPLPESFVGRPFIVILAGHGVETTQNFYNKKFLMKRDEDMKTEIGVIADAQGLAKEHIFDMGFMALSDSGNFIEYDGYSSNFGTRPHNEGQLPPGCSTVSFEVESIDQIDLNFVGEAVEDPSIAYAGGRSRTAIGPVGELIELVEKLR